MAFLYRCPRCGKRNLEVVDTIDGNMKTIDCKVCGLKKTMAHQEFATQIHAPDPIIQRRRVHALNATVERLDEMGIPMVALPRKKRRLN